MFLVPLLHTVPVVVLIDPDEYVFGLVPVTSNSSAGCLDPSLSSFSS